MSRNSLSNSSLLGREEEQGWPWVWELIGRPRPETHQRLRIRVADTVVFREGYPRTWVFTSKTGDVLRKAPDKLKNELIKEHLLRTAVEHNNRVAAVERRGRPSSPPRRKGPGGRARMLSEDEVSGLLKAEGGGGLLDGMLALQQHVPSRVGSNTRLRVEARLDRTVERFRFKHSKLCYLGAAAATADAPGSPMKAPAPAAGGTEAAPPPQYSAAPTGPAAPAFALRSVASALNASLEESVGAIIAHCEEVGRLKLVRLTADFVQDGESGEPTFIGCQEAVVLRPPPPQAKKKKPLNRMGSMAAASPLVAAALEAGQDPTDAEQLLVKQKSLQVLAAFGSPAKDARRQSQPPPPPPPKDDDADGAPAERAHWAVAGARPPPWARLHPPLLQGRAATAAAAGLSGGGPRSLRRSRSAARPCASCPGDYCAMAHEADVADGVEALGADLAASVGGLQGGSGEEAASFSVNYRSLFLARLERDAPTKLAREGTRSSLS